MSQLIEIGKAIGIIDLIAVVTTLSICAILIMIKETRSK